MKTKKEIRELEEKMDEARDEFLRARENGDKAGKKEAWDEWGKIWEKYLEAKRENEKCKKCAEKCRCRK